MKITCEVSLGELVDKISILQIKCDKFTDPEKLGHVQKELSLLGATLTALKLKGVDRLASQLKSINLGLWEIEDEIRLKEKQKEFDEKFISLARSVYVTNDQRFLVKNKINELYGSGIREVKSYEKYD